MVKYDRPSVKSEQQAPYCFEMAFKHRADCAELMSLLAHFKKNQRCLKSPFRSFVLSGACRYTVLRVSAVLFNLQWRGPWSIRSAELVPVGAGTGWKSMVFKWASPTLQQARRFLETTLVIPPVVRTDAWDNIWSCFPSHLSSLMHAGLQCLLSEAVWVWRPTPMLTSQQEHAPKPQGLHNWLQHVEIVPLITWPVKLFTPHFVTSTI